MRSIGRRFGLMASILVIALSLPFPARSDAEVRTVSPPDGLQLVSKLVRAGDTVIATKGDTVYAGGAILRGPANAAHPVVLHFEPGAIVEGGQDALTLAGASYWQVEGGTFRGAARAGLYVNKSPHINIRGVACLDNRVQGLLLSESPDAIVEASEFARSAEQHGFYGTRLLRVAVRGCKSHDNGGCDFQLNWQGAVNPTFTVSNETSSAGVIEDCEAWGSGGTRGGAAVNLLNVRDATVRNCNLHDGEAGGVSVYGCAKVLITKCTITFAPDHGRQCIVATNGSTDVTAVANTCVMGKVGIEAIQAYNSELAESDNAVTLRPKLTKAQKGILN